MKRLSKNQIPEYVKETLLEYETPSHYNLLDAMRDYAENVTNNLIDVEEYTEMLGYYGEQPYVERFLESPDLTRSDYDGMNDVKDNFVMDNIDGLYEYYLEYEPDEVLSIEDFEQTLFDIDINTIYNLDDLVYDCYFGF